MLTPALELAKSNRQRDLPERLRWALIELQVTDIGRAVCFWTTTLGLLERGTSNDGSVQLGTLSQTLIVLRPGARGPVTSGHAGMYHVALGVPSQQQFSRYLARLFDAKIRISPVDHTMCPRPFTSTIPMAMASKSHTKRPSAFPALWTCHKVLA